MPHPPRGADENSRSQGSAQTLPPAQRKRGQLPHSRVLRAPHVLPPPQTGCVRMENPNPSSVLVQHTIQAKVTAKGLHGLGWLSHTHLFQKGNPWQNMGNGESGILPVPLSPHRGPWVTEQKSERRRNEIHFLVTRKWLVTL